MQPADRKAIEHFVRVTLGCKCPDEVFQSIALERVGDCGCGVPCTRLVVGDRLLIHVVDAAGCDFSAETLAALARSGLHEREERGLNRFRLVIAGSLPRPLHDEAGKASAAVAGADERAHLHVIATAQVPRALRLKKLGLLRGRIRIPDDFDAPLPRKVLDDFDGS